MEAHSALGISGITNVVLHTTGGNSTIYRAHQDRFDRTVAIKVLSGPVTDELVGRFETELKIAGRLSGHPGIVEIYDSGWTTNGLPYFIMPFIDGDSLQRELDVAGRFRLRRAIADVIRISEAVDYSHRQGIIHRDLKPGNVLRGPVGQPLLTDFGIACLTTADGKMSMAGGATPVYTAPELFERGDPTPVSDVYSLGALTYALLAGRPAFLEGSDASVAAVINRVQRDDLKPILGIPESVMEVISHAMAKSPSDRPRSASLYGQYLRFAMQELDRSASESIGSRLVPQSGDDAEGFGIPEGSKAPARATRERGDDISTLEVVKARREQRHSEEGIRERTLNRTLAWTGASVVGLIALVALAGGVWRFVLDLTEAEPSATVTLAADEPVEEEEAESPAERAPMAPRGSNQESAIGAESTDTSDDNSDSAAEEPDAGTRDDEASDDEEAEEAEPEDGSFGSVSPGESAVVYEGETFAAQLPPGWVPFTENRDVGYGYRTQFTGPQADFLYVDSTPAERADGAESIKDAAYRVAESIDSASAVKQMKIGDKDTWWFHFMGEDGSRRVDVFFSIGNTGYAVVGGSFGDPENAFEAVHDFVASFETN